MKKFTAFWAMTICCLSVMAQNVGIGTNAPLAQLQINHRSSTRPGILLMDSTANYSGHLHFQHQANTRKMIVQGFSASNYSVGQFLDIRSDSVFVATFKGNGFMGIRNTNPAYALDVAGDINATGTIRLSGNPGNNGQVLTSSGTADPVWRNAALSNNIRFAVNINHSITTGHSLAPFTTIYNLSTADVTIGANTITVDRTGLYHFDIYFRAVFSDDDGVSFLNYYFSPSGTLPELLRDEPMPEPSPTSLITRKNFHFSLDVHLTAGAVISLGGYHVLGSGSGGTVTGKMYGHLISE